MNYSLLQLSKILKFLWKIFNFKLFPSSKIDFWPFLKWQKMELNYLISRLFWAAWTFSNFLAHYDSKWIKKILVVSLTFGSADKACCLTSQIISSLWNWRHFSTLSSGTPTRTRIKLDEVEELSDKLSSIMCMLYRVTLPWCWLSENRIKKSFSICCIVVV